jgi:tetrahydromethanopterin S-methyltransferase subunit F
VSLAGPLLDRPSAVGDEGRPRAASLAVASVAVAALVGATGYLVGELNLLAGLATLTGLTAAGVGLLDRERFVHLFFGHALLTWFGWPLALLVVAAPLYDRIGLAVSGFAVALFALAATWADAADRRRLRSAVYAGGRTYVATWVWLAAAALSVTVVLMAVGSLSLAAGAATPATAGLGFAFVLICSAGAVVAGLRWLPVRELTPVAHRETVAARVAALRWVAVGAMVAGTAFGALVVVLGLAGSLANLTTRHPWLAAALQSLASWPVLGSLATVGGLVLLAGLLALLARSAAARTDPRSAGRLAAAAAGLPLAVAMVVAVLLVLQVPYIGWLLAPLALLSPLLVVLLAGVAFAAAELRLAPDRAGGPAMAAVGLLAAAVGAADGLPLLTFGCVAAACLVWDVSTYGLGITAELGRLPDTRRLELVHGVLSVGIAGVAIGVVAGLDLLRTGAVAGVGGALPALLASVGALLLVVPLRG